MFSSEYTENKVLNITFEPSSSEDHFETKFKATISPSDKGSEKQEKNW